MITKQTVLVLGAGASSDYGYPLGRGLRDLVCALPKHPTSEAAVLDAGHSASDFHEFIDTLRHYGVVPGALQTGRMAATTSRRSS